MNGNSLEGAEKVVLDSESKGGYVVEKVIFEKGGIVKAIRLHLSELGTDAKLNSHAIFAGIQADTINEEELDDYFTQIRSASNIDERFRTLSEQAKIKHRCSN